MGDAQKPADNASIPEATKSERFSAIKQALLKSVGIRIDVLQGLRKEDVDITIPKAFLDSDSLAEFGFKKEDYKLYKKREADTATWIIPKESMQRLAVALQNEGLLTKDKSQVNTETLLEAIQKKHLSHDDQPFELSHISQIKQGTEFSKLAGSIMPNAIFAIEHIVEGTSRSTLFGPKPIEFANQPYPAVIPMVTLTLPKEKIEEMLAAYEKRLRISEKPKEDAIPLAPQSLNGAAKQVDSPKIQPSAAPNREETADLSEEDLKEIKNKANVETPVAKAETIIPDAKKFDPNKIKPENIKPKTPVEKFKEIVASKVGAGARIIYDANAKTFTITGPHIDGFMGKLSKLGIGEAKEAGTKRWILPKKALDALAPMQSENRLRPTYQNWTQKKAETDIGKWLGMNRPVSIYDEGSGYAIDGIPSNIRPSALFEDIKRLHNPDEITKDITREYIADNFLSKITTAENVTLTVTESAAYKAFGIESPVEGRGI